MSELYTLRGERVSLCVAAKGAELQSLKLDGQEYLWQGGGYWADRAPNLFPYVGRLTRQTYTHKGKPYRMDIHGFVKDSLLAAERRGESHISFALASCAQTLAQYPFPFEYRVHYRISGTSVSIRYEVVNTGDETMYFGIGGHPGFAVPLDSGLAFSDYRVNFLQRCAPRRVCFAADMMCTGEDAPFPLEDGRLLPLRHSLFDGDAVILSGTSGVVSLESPMGGRFVRVSYPGFRYLGLWHTHRSEAPFLCIEPWSSLPSRSGIVEELSAQPNLVALGRGDIYENEWSITPGEEEPV